MNDWNIATASVTGIHHEETKRNNQYWYGTYESEDCMIGVVCDGCGSGKHSEAGAAILGKFILNTLKELDISDYSVNSLKTYVKSKLYDYIEMLTLGYSKADKTQFISHYMLTTILFCIVVNRSGHDMVYIGISGDGSTLCNDTESNNDQSNTPNYIDYNNVLGTNYGFDINKPYIFETLSPYRCVIATDGVCTPLNELTGYTGRQLQRKFNLLQRKSKTFTDDATCIVFERSAK
jgi:hypothetical protein